jgi:hypothetical protein
MEAAVRRDNGTSWFRLIRILRILQILEVLDRFFHDLPVFDKMTPQTVHKVFLFSRIARVVVMVQ